MCCTTREIKGLKRDSCSVAQYKATRRLYGTEAREQANSVASGKKGAKEAIAIRLRWWTLGKCRADEGVNGTEQRPELTRPRRMGREEGWGGS